ncbi:MAG TPA: cytochrome c oxidase subunit 3 [Candidatus Saccharimonadales bacterium]
MTTHDMKRQDKVEFGFWLYLMTDLMLFASLFATFVVLRGGTNGGPSGQDIFNIDYVMVQTFILLASSVTSGLAFAAAKFGKTKQMISFLFGTILLGVSFLGLELAEFRTLVSEGHSWTHSAFLSSFFTLVGTHGIHIFIGLIWATVLLVILLRRGLSSNRLRKLGLFTMFWHFLDLVWIFIFTIVYVIGGNL